MQHGKVAGKQNRLTALLSSANRRGNRAIDAVQAAVRQHGKALGIAYVEGVQCAHRHAVGTEQQRFGGHLFQQGAHVRALQRRLGIEIVGKDALGASTIEQAPFMDALRKGRIDVQRVGSITCRLEHSHHEIQRVGSNEGGGLRIEIARFHRVHHDLRGAQHFHHLAGALGYGITPETHHCIEGGHFTACHYPVVPADHRRMLVLPQLGKRIGQQGRVEALGEGKQGLGLAVATGMVGKRLGRKRALTRKHHHTMRIQKLGQRMGIVRGKDALGQNRHR